MVHGSPLFKPQLLEIDLSRTGGSGSALVRQGVCGLRHEARLPTSLVQMAVGEVPINTSNCREEAQLVLHTSGDYNFEPLFETLCLNCPFRIHVFIPTSSGTCTSQLSGPSRANPTTREFQPSKQIRFCGSLSRRKKRKGGREGCFRIRTGQIVKEGENRTTGHAKRLGDAPYLSKFHLQLRYKLIIVLNLTLEILSDEEGGHWTRCTWFAAPSRRQNLFTH